MAGNFDILRHFDSNNSDDSDVKLTDIESFWDWFAADGMRVSERDRERERITDDSIGCFDR